MKRYFELTDETIKHNGFTLHRIRAIEDMSWYDIKAGDLGGFVESVSNLNDYAWIFDDAKVSDFAKVFDNARIYDIAKYMVMQLSMDFLK